MNRKLNAKNLSEKLGFQIANEDKIKEYIDISSPGIYRAGLELNGLENKKQKNIIVWGTKENTWFESNEDDNIAGEAIKKIIEGQPPMLFLSCGVKDKFKNLIIDLASNNNVPVIVSELHVAEIISIISYEVTLAFAKMESVHGSLVSIDGMGVMIIGKSGIGKSEVVLELIQDGYRFISDDTINLMRVGSKFVGYPADITKGFIEVRGIGLMDVANIYGSKIIADKSPVDLVIELVDASVQSEEFDRLGNKDLKYNILGGSITKMQLPVKYGKSIKSLVVAATSTFITKKRGFDPLKQMQKRIEGNNE